MSSRIQFLPLFFVVFVECLPFLFCTKKSTTYETSPLSIHEPIDTVYKTTLKDCPCTIPSLDSNRLEMTIDGIKLCFNQKRTPRKMYNDFWNISNHIDITSEWHSSDSSMMAFMFYANPAFLKHGMPYYLRMSTADWCELFNVVIYNFKPFRTCSCYVNDAAYRNYFPDNKFIVQIISFRNNTLEAKFSGEFSNYPGSRKFQVTDGYIKTRIEIENGRLPPYWNNLLVD